MDNDSLNNFSQQEDNNIFNMNDNNDYSNLSHYLNEQQSQMKQEKLQDQKLDEQSESDDSSERVTDKKKKKKKKNKNKNIKKDKKTNGDKKQKKEKKKEQTQEDDNSYLDGLITIMIHFFDEIKQKTGLLFQHKIHQLLRQIYPKYNFSSQAAYDQNIEQAKIKSHIQKSLLFRHFQQCLSSQQFVQFLKQFRPIYKEIKQSSYIFSSQISDQYYSIIIKILDIIFLHYTNDLLRQQKISQLGNQLSTNTIPKSNFNFISFVFLNKINNMNINKNIKKKCLFNNDFRKKNGPFCQMVNNIAKLFIDKIKDMSFSNLLTVKEESIKEIKKNRENKRQFKYYCSQQQEQNKQK